MLKGGELAVKADCCEVFLRKGYFSRDRKSDIVCDVTIEVTLPKQREWSLLWVFECKDYATPVPVDDVEEFHAKLQQIAGANVKGTMVVRGVLQKAALEYARSKGLGVMRILPADKVLWMNLSVTLSPNPPQRDESAVYEPFTNGAYTGINQDAFGLLGGSRPHGWREHLRRIVEEYGKATMSKTKDEVAVEEDIRKLESEGFLAEPED